MHPAQWETATSWPAVRCDSLIVTQYVFPSLDPGQHIHYFSMDRPLEHSCMVLFHCVNFLTGHTTRYYNNIANLKELFRLRHNSKLMVQ